MKYVRWTHTYRQYDRKVNKKIEWFERMAKKIRSDSHVKKLEFAPDEI